MGGITTTLFQRPRDPQFNNTTLLLSGNFPTNGAQNNTFLDSSSNGFSITRNGNTTQGSFSPFSQTGWSNYFNGTSDYLTATNSGFVATGDFTVEAWVYGTQTGAFQGIFVSSDGADTAGFRIAIENTNALGFWLNGTSNTGTTFLFNQWNHVAMVRSGTSTNNVSCYFNGTRVAQFTNTASTTNSTIAIGRYRTTGTNQYWFGGYISNARLVTGAALYSGATITVPTSPLAVAGSGVTQLLTCQSNRFIDNSSSPSTITVNGTPSIQPFSPFVPSGAYTTTAVGGSGYFDGTTDYLTYTTPSTVVREWWVNDFTVEAWIYPTTLTGWDYLDGANRISTVIGNASPTATNNFWSFGPINTGAVRLYYFNGAGVLVTSTETVKVNQWNHIAFTKTSTGIQIFVNGVGTTATAVSGTPQSGNTFPLTVGQINNTACNGYISGVRILNGTAQYSGTTYTIPTAPPTAITNTSLLLNFTNAGIFDSTAKNVLETVGNAQISTAVSRFGGSSMSFDGTTDYVVEPTNVNFGYGTGDFTIEFWLRLNSTALQTVVSNLTSDTSLNPHIYIASGGSIRYFTSNADRITGSTLSTNQWYHIAVCRSGTSTRLFIDGTQSGSTYTDSNNYGTTAPLGIGTYWSAGTPVTTNTLNGYIDDLRISKVARYTGNFNVPTIGFTDR